MTVYMNKVFARRGAKVEIDNEINSYDGQRDGAKSMSLNEELSNRWKGKGAMNKELGQFQDFVRKHSGKKVDDVGIRGKLKNMSASGVNTEPLEDWLRLKTRGVVESTQLESISDFIMLFESTDDLRQLTVMMF